MADFLEKLMPNIMYKPEVYVRSIKETLVMLGWSGAVSFLLGMFLGVVLIVTQRGGVMENRAVNQVFDKLINFFRSIPFIVLLAGLIPLTRLLMGTAIGVKGAFVPLVFGTTPFFARQVEAALAEIDKGVIEAALASGSGTAGIIFRVYLRESIASITRATTITIISLIGLTAMAGAVGAGGLGDFAIRYGHQRNQIDVTYVTTLTLVLMVSVIQVIGNFIARKNTR
ncbi:MAG: ABC transporter permease [Clostridiales Family XIII bacterium]|jgi:D-methionine transport system permease protein|nr:ABC transporter permease [Clostridiales Family XIII bacterium]